MRFFFAIFCVIAIYSSNAQAASSIDSIGVENQDGKQASDHWHPSFDYGASGFIMFTEGARDFPRSPEYQRPTPR